MQRFGFANFCAIIFQEWPEASWDLAVWGVSFFFSRRDSLSTLLVSRGPTVLFASVFSCLYGSYYPHLP
jgi:hypothetical protein